MRSTSLTEIAVELRAAMMLTEQTFAVSIAAVAVKCRRDEIEELAARIGLSAEATERILTDQDRCLALIAEAHRILRALIPHEATIRALTSLEQRDGPCA